MMAYLLGYHLPSKYPRLHTLDPLPDQMLQESKNSFTTNKKLDLMHNTLGFPNMDSTRDDK